MRVVGQAHAVLHGNGVVRIQTDIRVGTRYVSYCQVTFHREWLTMRYRTDKVESFRDKVTVVEELLAKDEK